MGVIVPLTRGEIDRRLQASPAERCAFIRDAAEAGVAEAQVLLGQMLLDGDGAPADARSGFGWFLRAAAQGHLMALNMVGRCYDLGWGVAVDKRRAAECFRIAAARGLDWAMYNYATALALGDGVAQDRVGALAWLEKAAALGNAKAINFIGSFYEDGWVVTRNFAVAARHYADAARGGDFRGMFNHARMLAADGCGDAALAWLTRCGAAANPAFLAKARAWLADCPYPLLRSDGIDALDAGAGAV